MFTALLRPHLARIYPCMIEEVRHNKQKELRIIDTLEPVMSGHKLVVAASVIRRDFTPTGDYPAEHAHKYQLFWQMSHLTRDKGSLAHEDRLDALAMAVGDCVAQMSQDADRNIQIRQEEELLADLAAFTGEARSSLMDRKLLADLAASGSLDDAGIKLHKHTLAQLSLQEGYLVGAGILTLTGAQNGAQGKWIDPWFG